MVFWGEVHFGSLVCRVPVLGEEGGGAEVYEFYLLGDRVIQDVLVFDIPMIYPFTYQIITHVYCLDHQVPDVVCTHGFLLSNILKQIHKVGEVLHQNNPAILFEVDLVEVQQAMMF